MASQLPFLKQHYVTIHAVPIRGPGPMVLCWTQKYFLGFGTQMSVGDLIDLTGDSMSVLSKALEGASVNGKSVGFTDEAFERQWPVLHALLTLDKDDDGKARKTCTLLLMCEDGQCKGVLKERNHDLSLWVTSSSILGVLGVTEEVLGSPPVPWRSNKKFPYRR